MLIFILLKRGATTLVPALLFCFYLLYLGLETFFELFTFSFFTTFLQECFSFNLYANLLAFLESFKVLFLAKAPYLVPLGTYLYSLLEFAFIKFCLPGLLCVYSACLDSIFCDFVISFYYWGYHAHFVRLNFYTLELKLTLAFIDYLFSISLYVELIKCFISFVLLDICPFFFIFFVNLHYFIFVVTSDLFYIGFGYIPLMVYWDPKKYLFNWPLNILKFLYLSGSFLRFYFYSSLAPVLGLVIELTLFLEKTKLIGNCNEFYKLLTYLCPYKEKNHLLLAYSRIYPENVTYQRQVRYRFAKAPKLSSYSHNVTANFFYLHRIRDSYLHFLANKSNRAAYPDDFPVYETSLGLRYCLFLDATLSPATSESLHQFFRFPGSFSKIFPDLSKKDLFLYCVGEKPAPEGSLALPKKTQM